MVVKIELFPDEWVDKLIVAMKDSRSGKIVENYPVSKGWVYLEIEIEDMFNFLMLGHRFGMNDAKAVFDDSVPIIAENINRQIDSITTHSSN